MFHNFIAALAQRRVGLYRLCSSIRRAHRYSTDSSYYYSATLSLSLFSTSTAHTVYNGKEQAVSTEHNTSPNKARTLFLFALSLANGLTSHNQTLVPTWLPSDGNRVAGLAASSAGVRTNLATRRPHTPLSCEVSKQTIKLIIIHCHTPPPLA